MVKKQVFEEIIEFKKLKPIMFCSSCKKINYKNKWVESEKKLFLDIIINSSNHLKSNAKGLRIIDVFREKNKFVIIFSWKKEDFVVEFPATAVLCKECFAKKSKAYSGILQIRNLNEGDFQEVNDFILKTINEEKGIVTKIERLKGGVDYYINPMKTLKKTGYEVVKRFGGIINFNEKLFTRDSLKSKDVYRVNILVRLPEFKIGDLISNENEIILITGHKKRLSGINIINNKNIILDERKIKDFKKEEIKRALVVKTYPRIEVLDPETFESIPIENQEFLKSKKKEIKINSEILVVIKNQRAYFYDIAS